MGGKAVSALVAEQEFEAAGLRPIEAYPGKTDLPWPAVCLICASRVAPRLGNIRRGHGGCQPCSAKARAARQVAAAGDAAVAEALGFGYRTLASFPGVSVRWRAVHLACGAQVWLRIDNLRAGWGACSSCGIRKSAASNLGDAEAAVADMRAALVEPLDPFPGTGRPWRSQCLGCGAQVRPKLNHIRSGRGGCRDCGLLAGAAKRRLDPAETAAVMLAAGFQPQEPYAGANVPWRCRCVVCGNVSRPTFQNVRAGSGCSVCCRHGFDRSRPAVVYVLHHPGLGAVKIGITGADAERVEAFTRRGWTLIGSRRFGDGADALTLEQAVLRCLRTERGLPHFLTGRAMRGLRGHTETFDASLIDPDELWQLVAPRVAGELG